MTAIDYETMKQFAYHLFGQMTDAENPVISPVSAYLTLAVAGCGANGTTKDEFYNVLGQNMEMLAGEIKKDFSIRGDYANLSLANAAWFDTRFTINNKWFDTARHLADAEIFQAELFQKETMDAINQWSRYKTNGMIDRLLTQPFDRQAMLALFNTIYFRGVWAYPFSKYKTKKEPFYSNGSSRASHILPHTKQVDMMNMEGSQLECISNDFAQGVILPYHTNRKFTYDETNPYDEDIQELTWDFRGKLAFVAIKPKGDISIREVYRRLDSKIMHKLLTGKKSEMIDLKLPKFEVVFDKVLNEGLINMGLAQCFDSGRADFSSMGKSTNGDTLYVELVRQKAKIIVNEHGTEAAAVTELIAALCAVFDTKKLYFNEPFFYMIMDMEHEMPLFMGILDNPAE